MRPQFHTADKMNITVFCGVATHSFVGMCSVSDKHSIAFLIVKEPSLCMQVSPKRRRMSTGLQGAMPKKAVISMEKTGFLSLGGPFS